MAAELTGIHLALGGDIVITLASTALLATRLPSARHDPPPVAFGSRPEEPADGHRSNPRELVDTYRTSP